MQTESKTATLTYRNYRPDLMTYARLGKTNIMVSRIGLTSFGQTQLPSMRMLLEALWIFTMEPHNDLLSSREENQAYALAEPGKQYAVYFTGDGDRTVQIDLSSGSGVMTVRWLDIANSSWRDEELINGGAILTLETPGTGQWAVLVKK